MRQYLLLSPIGDACGGKNAVWLLLVKTYGPDNKLILDPFISVGGLTMAEFASLVEYRWVNNQSLSPAGKSVFLWLTGVSLFLIGGLFAAEGAWPILVYALLQVVLLEVAFRRIARRDSDYEFLVIDGSVVRLETRCGCRTSRFTWNLPWVQLICRRDRYGGCDLAFRSCGTVIRVGRLLSEEQRLAWFRELRSRFQVAADSCEAIA